MDWAAVTVTSNTSFHCLRCLFFNNSIHFPTAVTSGTKAGGALKISSSSTAYLTSSTFANNTMSNSGKKSGTRYESFGGAAMGIDGSTSTAILLRCYFHENGLVLGGFVSRTGAGGALYVDGANVTLLHCRFFHNYVRTNGSGSSYRYLELAGAGAYFYQVKTATLYNCTFQVMELISHLVA